MLQQLWHHWNGRIHFALHHASPRCSAFSWQLQPTIDRWKKNSTLFCPISDRNISDILLQNVTSTHPLCVWDEHKYTVHLKNGSKRGIYCEIKFYTELQIEGEKIISFEYSNNAIFTKCFCAFAQFSFSSQLCFSVFLCNCSPFQKNWSTHLSSKKNQSSGDCGFWHSLFVSVSGAYRTFIVVSRNFSTFHTFSAMKVFFSFQCFASDQYCVCVWQPLAPAGHQPVPGFLREHKNALGRILIRNSSKFGQKFGPFCQSSSDGECFHYGAAVGPTSPFYPVSRFSSNSPSSKFGQSEKR